MTKRWLTEEQLAQLPPAMTARALGGSKPKAAAKKVQRDSPPPMLSPAPAKPTGMQAMQALGRLEKGVLNNTEQAYAEHLELRRRAGEVLWFKFEPMKLQLADNTTYAPDFLVQVASGHLELHEVKGFWTDDARVKIKVAAAMFPIFQFLAIKKGKKGQAAWIVETFK